MNTKNIINELGIDYIYINKDGHVTVISGETTPKKIKGHI